MPQSRNFLCARRERGRDASCTHAVGANTNLAVDPHSLTLLARRAIRAHEALYCSDECRAIHERLPTDTCAAESLLLSDGMDRRKLDAPMERVQAGMQTLLRGFRFPCDDEEERFLETTRGPAVLGCRVWSITHLVLCATFLLSYLQYDYPARYFLTCVPIFAIALGCGLLVTCPPLARRARKHVLSIISAAMVLMTFSYTLQSVVHTEAVVAWSEHKALDLVSRAIKDDPAAQEQLRTFLNRAISASLLNAQIAQAVIQVLLIAFIGFYRSTFLAAILMPVVFGAVVLWSPEIPLYVAVVRLGAYIIIIGTLVALTISVPRFVHPN